VLEARRPRRRGVPRIASAFALGLSAGAWQAARSTPHPEVVLRAVLRLLSSCLVLGLTTAAHAEVPTPSAFLKLDIGADRVLADYRQIRAYFAELDKQSPRVQMQDLGPTTLGERLVMAVISSEANIAKLPRLKEIAKKLADPRGLSAEEEAGLVREGRAFLLITCNIHSTEIGASQMAMEWAHALATATDPETQRRLDEVVLLLVPSLNPDGQIMETEWYRKWLGSKFEGGRMPWLYHHYVGHDDNRDWFMLTQKESQAMSHAVYHEWFPQVWLDEHQMGNTGPRIFVPPYAEPVDADIHPLIWREVNVMGSHMAMRMEQAGMSGIIYGYSFDAYWPGGTKNTAWFKNISGLLTEVASVGIATPLYIDPTELSGGRKGLVEYGAQTNFPNPWPGGWWRLRDIMDYERVASDAIHESCADHREDLLRDIAVRARATAARAKPGEAFRIPRMQRDWPTALRLASLLGEHNVELFTDASGDVWVPLAQPYGDFVREMLTTQRYPEVKLVGGPDIVRPYDVAAWSLPLMMGVTVENATMPAGAKRFTAPALVTIVAPQPARAGAKRKAVTPLPSKSAKSSKGAAAQLEGSLLPPGPESAKALNAALRSGGKVTRVFSETPTENASGTAVLDWTATEAAEKALPPGVELKYRESLPKNGQPLSAPRVAIYKPWAASMDEGWTRFLLEQYGFQLTTLDNATIQKGGLRSKFDAIVLPDVSKELIATGKPKREDGAMTYFVDLPPGYTGGLDKEGAKALKDFVGAGGTLVAFSSACDYVIEQFNMPVVNTLARAKADEFGCPGSLLRANVRQGMALTAGLPEEVALFVDKPIAFQTAPPGRETQRWVLATYPEHPDQVLLSGWIKGEDKLTNKAAAVAVKQGEGWIVLLGFRPQNRAQTNGTFPFLFNALYLSTTKH